MEVRIPDFTRSTDLCIHSESTVKVYFATTKDDVYKYGQRKTSALLVSFLLLLLVCIHTCIYGKVENTINGTKTRRTNLN